jgi:hypothetical protein
MQVHNSREGQSALMKHYYQQIRWLLDFSESTEKKKKVNGIMPVCITILDLHYSLITVTSNVQWSCHLRFLSRRVHLNTKLRRTLSGVNLTLRLVTVDEWNSMSNNEGKTLNCGTLTGNSHWIKITALLRCDTKVSEKHGNLSTILHVITSQMPLIFTLTTMTNSNLNVFLGTMIFSI